MAGWQEEDKGERQQLFEDFIHIHTYTIQYLVIPNSFHKTYIRGKQMHVGKQGFNALLSPYVCSSKVM